MSTDKATRLEKIKQLHRAMGQAIASRDLVVLLEHTGDMEMIVGQALQQAIMDEELKQIALRTERMLSWDYIEDTKQ